ncbi:AAA ATPase-like protein [Kribbella orskensis]|uniref:AAA ATPase-like protein n=1 Tax=Kribbella orskensis TaxID=2512216 RepID=A0ABY2BMR1_9ACTN|nr:AAA ATPase-like protein [Kribbella sp. VKM Ac-2500]TCO22995.1 AAA ATPase-like protein [Kribbella orskensis]
MGKTRLAATLCDELKADGVTTLWGRCVRFGSVDSPYVPLISALEGWVESADPDDRAQVLAAVPAAGDLLPSLGAQVSGSPVRLLAVADSLVMAIAARRPTALVVDDVQWADLASRDALAYLVAGFRTQRLVILATFRDEELGPGHPMHGWLADLRRLPAVTDLRLNRLTRDETEEQLSMLLGGSPQLGLVDDVVQRSDGNPYLSELLVHGLTVADERLPADLPDELSGALLAAWHRLSPVSREVMRILAVAGRPTSIEALTEVGAGRGIGPEALTTSLAEATNTGISVSHGTELCWFRHPLLAEVLYATFVPGEAAPVHAAWAKALESRSAAGLDELRRLGDLALHYEGAHDLPSCLDASVRAADLAKNLRSPREEAMHLLRASKYWRLVHDGDSSVAAEIDLLERVARANDLFGDSEAGFQAWTRLRELVDEHADPLRASRLVRRWADSAWVTGRGAGLPVVEGKHAVELSQPFPDSEEYAEALAILSWREAWNNEFGPARADAEKAVRAAEHARSTEALSLAYASRANAFWQDPRSDQDTDRAVRWAGLTDDPDLIWRTLVSRMNYLIQRGRVTECAALGAEFLPFVLHRGLIPIAVFVAGVLAHDLLTLGRLPECEQVIREGLSLPAAPTANTMVRFAATSLAVRRGDLHAAGLHMQRARELVPDAEEALGIFAAATLAEYLVATGEAEQALDLLSRTLLIQIADPRDADQMLMWGARAAADLAESARDRRDDEQVRRVLATFEDFVALRESVPPAPFGVLVEDDLIQPATKAMYVAERARCKAETPTSSLWQEVVDRCDAAGLLGEKASASWRLAQALLKEGAARAAIAGPLRSAYRYATEVGATPLQQQVETLAGLSRIPLREPVVAPQSDTSGPWVSLTKREREVLSHLVVGRTYPEIAAALFISEKTVSTHVSNLLHKTGTSSRQEVSALALRLGQTAAGRP